MKKLPRKFTSKNIKTSINYLMQRNYDIFGPPGRNFYVPNKKKEEGGEMVPLDQMVPTENLSEKDIDVVTSLMGAMHKGEQIEPMKLELEDGKYNIKDGHHRFIAYINSGFTEAPAKVKKPKMKSNMNYKKSGGSPFPTQPTDKQFFEPGFIPTQPQFSYNKGGAPCYECGGHNNQAPPGYHIMPDGMLMSDSDMEGYYKAGGQWIQKAAKSMKAKGTKGAFTEYCGGNVTDACIKKGLNSDDPTIRKRAAFAKAMRNIAKKKMGGSSSAPQGDSIDSITQSRKDYFTRYIGSNTMTALALQEAEAMAATHDQAVAQFGTEVGAWGYNPQMAAVADQFSQSARVPDDMGTLYAATMNLAETQNPYYEMSYMEEGGTMDGYQEWLKSINNPVFIKRYMSERPRASSYPHLVPMNQQPYYKFRANYAPGSGSFFPQGMSPENARNFTYDYRGRLFGQGPRKVKMSWDEFVPGKQSVPVQDENSPLAKLKKWLTGKNQNQVTDPNMISYLNDLKAAKRSGAPTVELPPAGSSNYMRPMIEPVQMAPYSFEGMPLVTPPLDVPGQLEFKAGGVYELTPAQILAIKQAGGEIEFLDDEPQY